VLGKFEKEKNIFYFLGITFICISIFFKHSRGFFWSGSFLVLIYLVASKDTLYLIVSNFRYFSIVLILFIFFLLLAVFYSPFPFSSLDAFLVNYILHIIIFIGIIVFVFQSKASYLEMFYILIFLVNIIANFYCIFHAIHFCNLDFKCLLFSGMNQNMFETGLLKDLVFIPPAYLLLFALFLALFLTEKHKLKYFYGLLGIWNLAFLFWFGRRACLIGIFIASIFSGYFSNSKKFKKNFYTISLLIVGLISAFFLTPYGKTFWIRSDKISILLSGNYSKFKEAGSLGLRLYAWPLYLKAALENPFKGTGLARRVQKRVLLQKGIEQQAGLGHAHNTFLNIWLQAGIQTVTIFLVLYVWTIITSIKLAKNKWPYNVLGGFLLVFLISHFVLSMFAGLEELTRFTPFWIGSGLVWGYAARASSTSSG